MSNFKFNISLSILNHLGRSLYRNFITVLGEAISNSWDADATVVEIFLDKENDRLIIKDDGIGMNEDDFQNRFLKIGYSKRKETNSVTTDSGRPYIGRKGIGKLALLSCAKKVSIISKKTGQTLIGGTIDNSKLDEAIKKDVDPDEYPLGKVNFSEYDKYQENFDHGTIIIFNQLNSGIKGREERLRKLIALSFKFTILDPNFTIKFNDKEVNDEDLRGLINDTQFVWKINGYSDSFVEKIETASDEDSKFDEAIVFPYNSVIKGFIASVKVPSNLNIDGTGTKTSIDLFVNGRLREKGVSKHLSSARVPISYFYGQLHYNSLEGEEDNFTSSREGIKQDAEEFKKFKKDLTKIINKIIDEWDKLRSKYKDDGDSESKRLTPKQRKAEELTNVISKDYKSKKKKSKSKKDTQGNQLNLTQPTDSKDEPKSEMELSSVNQKDIVDEWLDDLSEEAKYNVESYAECFLAENIARKYIKHKNVELNDKDKKEVEKFREREKVSKEKGNISFPVRKVDIDENYLDMGFLANLVDRDIKDQKSTTANLYRDADKYKPLRDAMAHTSTLTPEAKRKLSSTFDNIKGRIKNKLKDL